MTHKRVAQTRQKLLGRLPDAAGILRGSLWQRTIRHASGCPKCARGEGLRRAGSNFSSVKVSSPRK
jgi:hypothetical protein